MESRTAVICSECYEPIVPGEGFGFASFKIPGQEGYHFFHRRFPGGDCWEVYVVEKPTKAGTAQKAAPVVNWL